MYQPAEYGIKWWFHSFTVWMQLAGMTQQCVSRLAQEIELTSGHTELPHSQPCSSLPLGCGTKGSRLAQPSDQYREHRRNQICLYPHPLPLLTGGQLYHKSGAYLTQCRLIHVWARWIWLDLEHPGHGTIQAAIHSSSPSSCWPARSERTDCTGKSLSTPTHRCAGQQASPKLDTAVCVAWSAVQPRPSLCFRVGVLFYSGNCRHRLFLGRTPCAFS